MMQSSSLPIIPFEVLYQCLRVTVWELPPENANSKASPACHADGQKTLPRFWGGTPRAHWKIRWKWGVRTEPDKVTPFSFDRYFSTKQGSSCNHTSNVNEGLCHLSFAKRMCHDSKFLPIYWVMQGTLESVLFSFAFLLLWENLNIYT